MIARIQRSESGTAAWQAAFEALLPRIRRQAGIAFRTEPQEAREELIEETVANCLIAFARLVALGKQDRAYPSALARFAIAQVRSGAGPVAACGSATCCPSTLSAINASAWSGWTRLTSKKDIGRRPSWKTAGPGLPRSPPVGSTWPRGCGCSRRAPGGSP